MALGNTSVFCVCSVGSMPFFCSTFWTGASALHSALHRGNHCSAAGLPGRQVLCCCSKAANLALPATPENILLPCCPVIKCHPNCTLPSLPLQLPPPTAPQQPPDMGAGRELVPWPCCLGGTGAASSPYPRVEAHPVCIPRWWGSAWSIDPSSHSADPCFAPDLSKV